MSNLEIKSDKLSAAWQQADDIERRVLGLAFLLPIDQHGWTLEKYSLQQLHKILGYERSGPTSEKLKAIFKKFEVAGLMSTYPPKGKRRQLWFGYAIQNRTAAPTQPLFDLYHQLITGQTCDSESHLINQMELLIGDLNAILNRTRTEGVALKDAIQNHTFASICDSESVFGNRTFPDLDLEEEDQFIKDTQDRNLLLAAAPQLPSIEQLLDEAGIKDSHRASALKHIEANALSREQVQTIVRNAQAGRDMKKVKVLNSYVGKCLMNGLVSTNFLDEQAELAEQKEREAKEKQRQEEIDQRMRQMQETPEQRSIRLEAEAAAQRDYDALLLPYRQQMNAWDSTSLKPQEMWQAVMNSLSAQLHRATFESWVEGSELVGIDKQDGLTLVIQATNNYSKDWLETRFTELIKRLAVHVFHQENIDLMIVVAPKFGHPALNVIDELASMETPSAGEYIPGEAPNSSRDFEDIDEAELRPEIVWAHAQQKLREKIIYNSDRVMFLDNSRYAGAAKGVIYIRARTAAIRDEIHGDRYYPLFASAVREVSGGKWSVRFLAPKEEVPEMAQAG